MNEELSRIIQHGSATMEEMLEAYEARRGNLRGAIMSYAVSQFTFTAGLLSLMPEETHKRFHKYQTLLEEKLFRILAAAGEEESAEQAHKVYFEDLAFFDRLCQHHVATCVELSKAAIRREKEGE